MRDKVSIGRASKLHPAIRDEVVKLIDKAEVGLPVFVAIRIVQELRTIEEQDTILKTKSSTINSKYLFT